MELVYAQLRRVAHNALRKARVNKEDLTLETGDLFHESYLKLRSLKPQHLSFDHRGGFFHYCIRIMQCHLREHSEKKQSLKRGGDFQQVSLDALVSPDSLRTLAEIMPDKRALSFADILAFEDLLERHRAQFQRQADVLAHKVYLEMKDEEIALVLGISIATVNRDLRDARAWLAQQLNPPG
jgi:RNA polymerase sigma factor (sigma-70 family)